MPIKLEPESESRDLKSKTSYLIQTKELQNNWQVNLEAQFINSRIRSPEKILLLCQK